jgi:DNA-binding NarL/FixJ family response regulator
MPLSVFLVEDSPLLRTRLEAMLASIAGARLVGHASGARAAIAGILAARPHAAVLDLHLDEGNGFEVLAAVQSAGLQIAAYVLTNFPSEPHRRKAERLGARGFFDKSSEFHHLRDALAALAR